MEGEGRQERVTDTKGTLGRAGLRALPGQRAGTRVRPSVIQLVDLGQFTANPKGSSFCLYNLEIVVIKILGDTVFGFWGRP